MALSHSRDERDLGVRLLLDVRLHARRRGMGHVWQSQRIRRVRAFPNQDCKTSAKARTCCRKYRLRRTLRCRAFRQAYRLRALRPDVRPDRIVDVRTRDGAELRQQMAARVQRNAEASAIIKGGTAKPVLVIPRLGQATFRIELERQYQMRCAVTGERTRCPGRGAHQAIQSGQRALTFQRAAPEERHSQAFRRRLRYGHAG